MDIDKVILNIDKAIEKNIGELQHDSGLLAQNILSQLRNLVEKVAIKIYLSESSLQYADSYEETEKALNYIKSKNQYIELRKFHTYLTITAAHTTLDEEASERIMHKYIENLYILKDFIYSKFNLEILKTIHRFPLSRDGQTEKYYKEIIEKISVNRKSDNSRMERCYIQKKRRIFNNGKIYYELTITLALSKISKFDRIIVFTKHNVQTNYAVKLWLNNDHIKIVNENIPIKIAVDWEVSIRPCEFRIFSKVFGTELTNIGNSTEVNRINEYLTNTKINLANIVDLQENEFIKIKNEITTGLQVKHFFDLLEKVKGLREGKNVVKYLLYHMNHRIIKNQLGSANHKLSYLNLAYGCIPFDEMPFCSSLIGHDKIRFFDLVDSIGLEGREHELIARKIKNNSEVEGKIYSDVQEFERFLNLDDLIKKYNKMLYHKHLNRIIIKHGSFLFIDEYEYTIKQILKILEEKTTSGVGGYKNSAQVWINQNKEIDCEKKREILPSLFDNSKIALIYGSAGTGKTTLVKYLTEYLNLNSLKRIIYVAHTNTAVDNLRKRIGENNGEFKTVNAIINGHAKFSEYDLIVVDESSTVSNRDMLSLLNAIKGELYLFVGDTYQIESIEFGNWFTFAKSFIKKESVFELDKQYRTEDQNLLKLWKVVRENEPIIADIIARYGYAALLDETVFNKTNEDEIVLCLNYDGLYGINNINRLLQSRNDGESIEVGLSTYKINDPILFNETRRFGSILHNNLKGKIVGLNEEKSRVEFIIEIDKPINELEAKEIDVKLIEVLENGKSIISFYVSKIINTDEENDDIISIVPFQVAYAMSIHKSQGLEYESVKIVISNEVDERITHNIFYTAITRSRKHLKIFWSNEAMQSIISSFKLDKEKKDLNILKNKIQN